MLRVALAQINPIVGDLQGNKAKIEEYILRARQNSVDVIAFPELALTGYPPEDLLFKKHFIRDNLKAFRSLVHQTAKITVVLGFVNQDKSGYCYNSAGIIYDRKLIRAYNKNALPNYGVFDEKRYFIPGKENFIFSCGDGAFGVSICEDIWIDNGPCREQARAGAGALINISSSPYHMGKSKERFSLLKKRAVQNKAFVLYVNLVGGQDELVFDGSSLILDPKGRVIATGKAFEEDLVVADLLCSGRPKKITDVLPSIMLKGCDHRDSRIKIQGQQRRPISRTEEIYRALVLGTHDYIRKNGFKKVILGLSGGIDSALVAMIAVDAIGPENVVAVSMPSRFSSRGTKTDARRLAKNLKIQFFELSIEKARKAYAMILKGVFTKTKKGIAEENVQARIRGNILMALSNKFGWLVLTTGNKSEIAVGYCTLYGDMAGGFCVLKDVPKTRVYDLVRFKNRLAKKNIIPASILKRSPTAELKKDQKDQDTLPPYAILDSIIESYVERDKSLEIIISKAPLQKRKKFQDMARDIIQKIDHNEYKRRQAPPGVKITPKAFGRDRRLPVTNQYRE